MSGVANRLSTETLGVYCRLRAKSGSWSVSNSFRVNDQVMLDTYTWIAVNHCVLEENVLEIYGMKAWPLNKLIKVLKKDG